MTETIIKSLKDLVDSKEVGELIKSYSTDTQQNDWLTNWSNNEKRDEVLEKLGKDKVKKLHSLLFTLVGMELRTSDLKSKIQKGGNNNKYLKYKRKYLLR
jgi:hypothetical protein